jgi:hypothetical protein
MDLGTINWIAVLVATLAAFFLGFLWYSFFFQKTWMREMGFTEEQLRQSSNMGKIFGSTLFLTFLMSLGLAMLWHTRDMSEVGWLVGMYHGLLIGILFVATSMGINYLYQRKSFTLWAIDAGYQVTFLGLIGAILGAWN